MEEGAAVHPGTTCPGKLTGTLCVVLHQPVLALMAMEAHFFRLELRRLGASLWLHAEPTAGPLGSDHALHNLRPLRFGTESAALHSLESAGVGRWSSFPHEGVGATLTRSQLRSIGFRGNF